MELLQTLQVLFTSEASLTFVDLLSLAEKIRNLKVVCCFLFLAKI